MNIKTLSGLYGKGKSLAWLGAQCGCPLAVVRKKLAAAGVKIRNRGVPIGSVFAFKITLEQRAALIESLRNEVVPQREIASRFGVSKQYVSLLCKQHKINPRFRDFLNERKKERAAQIENEMAEKKKTEDEFWAKVISLIERKATAQELLEVIATVSKDKCVSRFLHLARKRGRKIPTRFYSCGRFGARAESPPDPRKRKARRILNYGVRWGYIKRLPCSVCGNPKSEGHHPDYDKPKEVVWLCNEHHREIHSKVSVDEASVTP